MRELVWSMMLFLGLLINSHFIGPFYHRSPKWSWLVNMAICFAVASILAYWKINRDIHNTAHSVKGNLTIIFGAVGINLGSYTFLILPGVWILSIFGWIIIVFVTIIAILILVAINP